MSPSVTQALVVASNVFTCSGRALCPIISSIASARCLIAAALHGGTRRWQPPRHAHAMQGRLSRQSSRRCWLISIHITRAGRERRGPTPRHSKSVFIMKNAAQQNRDGDAHFLASRNVAPWLFRYGKLRGTRCNVGTPPQAQPSEGADGPSTGGSP